MPPKSKRQRTHEKNLEKARDSKRIRLSDEGESSSATQETSQEERETRPEPEELADLLTLSENAINTDNEAVDPTFNMDASIRSDIDHMTDNFCEEWVTHLGWEDRA